MRLKLDFEITPPQKRLSIRESLFMSGSCFAENIGQKFISHKFNACVNPHGILFNPMSMMTNLLRVIEGTPYTDEEIFESNGLWHSWNHHGDFTSNEKNDLLEKMNVSLQIAHQHFHSSTFIFLTFGTAYSYVLNETGQTVANCHKFPQNKFTRKLLSENEILESFAKLIPLLKDKQVVFTVSPVRYIRDGVIENNLSKAILLKAVHEICNTNKNAYYFPAYEIVMDELRDYRWFDADLVHPNKQAVAYVWERFSEVMFDDETKEILKLLTPILQARHHQPIHAQSESHREFLKTYGEKVKSMNKAFPFLELDEEKKYFGS